MTFRVVLVAVLAAAVDTASAQWATEDRSQGPTATFVVADRIHLTGDVDSNSPVVRDLVDGRATTVVMTSFAGRPSRATGTSLAALGGASPVAISPWPEGGVWMEAVIPAADGTWYYIVRFAK